ncbi:MAG: TonB-dependent receptor [Xylophilus ampelinus]
MTTCTASVRLAALPLALAAAFPFTAAVAQTAPASLPETVVTATRVAQPLSDLVADVTVIDADAIARSGAVGVADVLARQPGIEIARNGGPGQNTSVFIRGADSRFTAVYLDGVRIDSQSTGGAIWEQIPLAQIDRIEILRGPAAAVYGSDAINGVIQLFTRKGEPGKPAPYAGVGVGSYGLRRAEAGVSGVAGEGRAVDYAIGAAHEESHGFNVQPNGLRTRADGLRNPDRDGYRTTSASARVGLQVDPRHRIEGNLVANNLVSGYDGSGYLAARPVGDQNHHQLRTGGLNWQAKWTDQYSTRLQVTESRTRYETTPSPYVTLTDLRGYLFQNEWRSGPHLATAALERREDRLEQPLDNFDRKRAQNALALGYGFRQGPHTVQLNARHDEDSEFGGKTTGSAAYGYAIAPQLRATVSAGTAFRAPTLYQRFSEYGVAGLRPEESRNLEAGLHWTQGASSAGVVVYRNRVTDLINFGGAGTCRSSFGCYANVGRAELQGATLTGAHRLGGVNLRASADFQDPRNLDTDKLLARRSRRHATLAADTDWAGWNFGGELQASARRFDDAANARPLGGYALVNLYASTRIARDFTLVARIDNLADKDYQLARTYATPGRTAYLGVKWAPR